VPRMGLVARREGGGGEEEERRMRAHHGGCSGCWILVSRKILIRMDFQMMMQLTMSSDVLCALPSPTAYLPASVLPLTAHHARTHEGRNPTHA
jgi:hypothetical protein